jgi:protoheme IX farnesyltransferase
MNFLKTLLELSKVKITVAVAFTTVTGYLLARERFDTGMLLPTLGIFILACGSSALNHYQEREKDALMERTRKRPIPSGRISEKGALLFALILTIAGSWILYDSSGMLAMQLGLLALLWYNGIYTPLKNKTAFAVIPGAVIGAIPPLVGWVAGGGSLLDVRAMIMAFFFFIWQVPHFWLLMLKYGNEYEQAGFPSITKIYSEDQIKNVTFIWVLATAVSALMIPVFYLTQSWLILAGFLIACIWVIVIFSRLLTRKNEPLNPMYYFMRINYFVLAIIILMGLQPFV